MWAFYRKDDIVRNKIFYVNQNSSHQGYIGWFNVLVWNFGISQFQCLIKIQ